jgi:hypothetical protein
MKSNKSRKMFNATFVFCLGGVSLAAEMDLHAGLLSTVADKR